MLKFLIFMKLREIFGQITCRQQLTDKILIQKELHDSSMDKSAEEQGGSFIVRLGRRVFSKSASRPQPECGPARDTTPSPHVYFVTCTEGGCARACSTRECDKT